MIHSAAFVYTSLLVVMVVRNNEFHELTILPCGRQCNAKTCIWYQEHLQSPTAHLNSTNSCSKLSISPLIRYVADLVSFLCFLLCILLQFLTILINRASGLNLGTFYQNGALSRHFSYDFPCSPTLLLLFLPSHSLLICLSLCRFLTGLNPYILLDLWLQNGKTVLVIFSSFAPLLKNRLAYRRRFPLVFQGNKSLPWYGIHVQLTGSTRSSRGGALKSPVHEGTSLSLSLSLF